MAKLYLMHLRSRSLNSVVLPEWVIACKPESYRSFDVYDEVDVDDCVVRELTGTEDTLAKVTEKVREYRKKHEIRVAGADVILGLLDAGKIFPHAKE